MGEDCTGEREGQKKTCWNLGGNLKKNAKEWCSRWGDWEGWFASPHKPGGNMVQHGNRARMNVLPVHLWKEWCDFGEWCSLESEEGALQHAHGKMLLC